MKVEEQATRPVWASYADAEDMYGLSRTTLWRLLKSGEIRGARVGRSVRIECQSVESYLERQAADFEG